MRYRRLIGTAALVAAFVAMPTVEAWGQKDKKKEMPEVGAKDSSKIASGEYVGVLKGTPGSDRTFTVELETTKLVPTGGGGKGGGNNNVQRILQAQNKLRQAQMQMARADTPQERMRAMGQVRQAMMQMQQAQGQMSGGGGTPAGFKVEKDKVLVEFQATEKAKVRTLLLPETFDDKGKLRIYTAKEKSELKGADKAAVGYESALEKLENGQTVKVTLVSTPRPTGAADKDKDDDVDPEKSKQVKLIVVLKAADPSAAKGEKKKKN